MRNVPRPTRSAAITAACVLLAAVHFVGLYMIIARRYTFEDQTLFWDIARDLRAGDFHQIDFPGQFYGSSLEAVPIALLGAVGYSDATAYSLSLLSFAVAGWAAMAVAVHRRGHPWLARSVVLFPVVLTVDYNASALMWATAAPRTLAVVAVAVALGSTRPGLRWGSIVALGGVAVIFDTSTALIVGPTVAWMAFTDGRRIPVRCLAGGAILPLMLVAGRLWHHSRHPEFDLHPAPSTAFGWKSISWHAHNPTRTLRALGPEAFLTPAIRSIAVLAVLIAVAVLVWNRGDRPGRVALAVGVIGLAIFYASEGSLRSAEFTTAILSVGRGLMSLPFLVVFLVAVSIDRAPGLARPIFAVLAVLAVAGLGVRTFDDSPREFVDDILATTAVDVWRLDDLDAVCTSATEAVHETGTTVVLSSSPTLAWGCAASLPSSIVLFPIYERRTWELEDAWGVSQAQWVVLGRGDEGCSAIADEFACEPFATDVVVISTPAMTTPDAVDAAGLWLRRLPPGWPEE